VIASSRSNVSDIVQEVAEGRNQQDQRVRTKQFVLDGEAVLLGVDGISDFDGLYSGQHNDEIQLYAFDILTLDGDDLGKLPLHLRKTNLARLLARRADGIHLDAGCSNPADLAGDPRPIAPHAIRRNVRLCRRCD
jgi:ATP-dependent DNA ligase